MRFLTRLVALVLGTLGIAQQAAPKVRVIDLEGTPYERGLQHGKALKAEIAALWPHFEADLASRSGGSAADFIDWFLGATHYDEAIRRHVPELLDEVRGIAAGAGRDFEAMLVYQLIDEYWVQSMLRSADKCTTIGVAASGDRPTIVAQNLDVPKWMHRYPTVLRIHHSDSELTSLVVTIPGVIGAMGCSSARVGVGVNTILQIQSCRDGLPVAFVVRGVLAQPDVEAARAFVERVKHASGQAYTIGGPADVTCHECSANGAVRFLPASGPERVWHTNHPVASSDFADWFVAASKRAGKSPAEVDVGCTRFPAIEGGLLADGPCGLDEVIALLSEPAHGVCNQSTYACIVMSLGQRPFLRVTPGAPNAAEFVRVDLGPR